MVRKLRNQISLRIDDNIYSSLLIEAEGDPRQIPDVIRQKLADAYLSRDDARIIKTQQEMIITLLRDLLLDNVPTVVRMQGILAGYDADKRQHEKEAIESLAKKKMDLLERLSAKKLYEQGIKDKGAR